MKHRCFVNKDMLLKCKMETQKMNRGCDVQDYLCNRCKITYAIDAIVSPGTEIHTLSSVKR